MFFSQSCGLAECSTPFNTPSALDIWIIAHLLENVKRFRKLFFSPYCGNATFLRHPVCYSRTTDEKHRLAQTARPLRVLSVSGLLRNKWLTSSTFARFATLRFLGLLPLDILIVSQTFRLVNTFLKTFLKKFLVRQVGIEPHIHLLLSRCPTIERLPHGNGAACVSCVSTTFFQPAWSGSHLYTANRNTLRSGHWDSVLLALVGSPLCGVAVPSPVGFIIAHFVPLVKRVSPFFLKIVIFKWTPIMGGRPFAPPLLMVLL